MNDLILFIAFWMDMLLGDPPRMPHIVVAIGRSIAWLERRLRPLFPVTPRGEIVCGALLVALVLALSVGIPLLVLSAAGRLHPAFRLVLECFILYQLLAARCLMEAAGRVFDALEQDDLPAARTAAGMIVGRDTAELDEAGVIRAAVETVAENTSDGVVAPMFYFAVGGLPAALAYKAINTMDSMIGYKNERYLHFGRAAARLDDVANILPARLTAWLMIIGVLLARFNWRRALRAYLRDRRAHSSPNSGHPESACAGALGIQLGGASSYGGRVVEKPALGDATREIESLDILRAIRLLQGSAVLALLLCGAITILLKGTKWL